MRYRGEEYLFLYSRSEETASTICALVPIEVITKQAVDIKEITITLIVLACVIALGVGIFTVMGIQKNMKNISKKFGEVARGDLTVQVKARGRDEFCGLADSATSMIKNTKKLVHKVSNATEELEKSAKDVDEVSDTMDGCSKDIMQAIGEINEGVVRQARHAEECVSKTDALSNEIQKVAHVIGQVEKLVKETEERSRKGICCCCRGNPQACR